MGSDVRVPASPSRFGRSFTRYRSVIEMGVAAIVGVVVLPAIFLWLRSHDIQLVGKVSLVDLGWLVLAFVAVAIILRARSSLMSNVDGVMTRFIAAVPQEHLPRPVGSSSGPVQSVGSDRSDGIAIVHTLIDLILLFVIQAVVRQPLVGVFGPQVSPAIVDGAFVVVVLLIAVSFLIRLRHASRSLIEKLVSVGLDQVVPTAGFTSGSAASTFAARLTTTTSRLAATSSRGATGRIDSSAAGPTGEATGSAGATVVASRRDAASDEATVVAPAPNASPLNATVAAINEPAVDEATIVARSPVVSPDTTS